jgi:hypothetical protein
MSEFAQGLMIGLFVFGSGYWMGGMGCLHRKAEWK